MQNGIMDIRIRDVPKELHIAYKLTVTANQTSIQKQTRKLIHEYVRTHNKVQYSGRDLKV